MAVIVSHDHALADDNVFQLNVLAVLYIGLGYVKLLHVTDMLFRVTVHDAQLLRVDDQSNAL